MDSLGFRARVTGKSYNGDLLINRYFDLTSHTHTHTARMHACHISSVDDLEILALPTGHREIARGLCKGLREGPVRLGGGV